jgi:penicillin-binding protein 1B
MPRIEDEDDLYDDDADGGDSEGPGWRNRLLTWGVAAAALLLGFLVPYMLYLNHQVGERFGKLRWQVPTRVYARPLLLRTGLAMDAQTLKTELDAASGPLATAEKLAEQGFGPRLKTTADDVLARLNAKRTQAVPTF